MKFGSSKHEAAGTATTPSTRTPLTTSQAALPRHHLAHALQRGPSHNLERRGTALSSLASQFRNSTATRESNLEVIGLKRAEGLPQQGLLVLAMLRLRSGVKVGHFRQSYAITVSVITNRRSR